MKANIPETNQKRVVIIGAGFGGLMLAEKLAKNDYQIVLVDKNNYHQFQPLFYQVAMAGIEPSSISFPLRKVFQNRDNVHIRITSANEVVPEEKCIHTDLGIINYDYLVLAMGADTNFFGNKEIEEHSMPMKSLSEAIALRNKVLENYEKAISTVDLNEREAMMSVVVVGGGPTGVEIAGTLAEMKKMILPKDYNNELDFDRMKIHLIEGSENVLDAMSNEASTKAKEYLERLGVHVITGARVNGYDGEYASLSDGSTIRTDNLVWAAGIKSNHLEGFKENDFAQGGRFLVNEYNQLLNHTDIFAVGDLAQMESEKYPHGHPQMAQPAIQQGKLLANNFVRMSKNEPLKTFKYSDLGSMATVGRNLAVVDLPFWKFQGFFAWLTWMFVHLMSLLGVKNKVFVFLNWVWNYVTYDQSLRLIIKPVEKTPPESPAITNKKEAVSVE
jgi:NADH dehydrogenase